MTSKFTFSAVIASVAAAMIAVPIGAAATATAKPRHDLCVAQASADGVITREEAARCARLA